jgi:predicted dehydrogenase
MRNEASELEVSADAGTDFLLKYEGGITGHVHLNYFEQPANRFLHLVFSQGRLEFYFFKNELHHFSPNSHSIEKAENFERNHLFVNELAHFFNLINSGNYGDINMQMLQESETIITMCLNKPLKKV